MDSKQVLTKLKSLESDMDREGQARFGINTDNSFGISIYVLRDIAKEIGTDHQVALKLWKSGIREARILASYIDDPKQVTEDQMEDWVADFNSWDVVDQVSSMFEETPFVHKKILEWSKRDEEFVKRTAFALIAGLAVHDKQAEDKDFEVFFDLIKREAHDDRNFVRKSANWALRNIGKRNIVLNKRAIEVAEEIKKQDTKSARWIANDALRELTSEKMQNRLKKKVSGPAGTSRCPLPWQIP